MPRLCEKCMSCHPVGTKCKRQLTLKQIAKKAHQDYKKLLKDIEDAEQKQEKHPSKQRYAGIN
jgi:hypothetical protein